MQKVLSKAISTFRKWNDISPSYLNNMLIFLAYKNRTSKRKMRKCLMKARYRQKSASNSDSGTLISVDQVLTKTKNQAR